MHQRGGDDERPRSRRRQPAACGQGAATDHVDQGDHREAHQAVVDGVGQRIPHRVQHSREEHGGHDRGSHQAAPWVGLLRGAQAKEPSGLLSRQVWITEVTWRRSDRSRAVLIVDPRRTTGGTLDASDYTLHRDVGASGQR